MNWKAILAVLVIIAILGLLFVTNTGINYLDSLRKYVGNFISVILKTPTGQPFGMEMEVNKQPFYGQSYNVANSTFSGSGVYQKMTVGGIDLAIKSDKKVNVIAENFNGKFEYTADGVVKLNGESSQIEIGDVVYSAGKPTKLYLELVPFSFSVSGVAQDKVSLQLVSGDVKTEKGQAHMDISKLSITSFAGDISLSEDEKVKLNGTATSIIGDRFSFT